MKPEPQTDVGHWKRVSDSETNFSLGAGHKPKSHNLKRPRATRTGDRRDDGHTGSLNLSLRLPLRALVPAGPDFVDSVQVAQGPQPEALPVALADGAPAQTQPEVRVSRKRRRSSVVLYTRPVVGSSQGVKLEDHDMPRSRPKWAEWTDAQADGSFLGLTRSAGPHKDRRPQAQALDSEQAGAKEPQAEGAEADSDSDSGYSNADLESVSDTGASLSPESESESDSKSDSEPSRQSMPPTGTSSHGLRVGRAQGDPTNFKLNARALTVSGRLQQSDSKPPHRDAPPQLGLEVGLGVRFGASRVAGPGSLAPGPPLEPLGLAGQPEVAQAVEDFEPEDLARPGRRHQCSFCPYLGKSRWEVRVHERTHTGDKPYQCSFCDYKANQRGNMRTHERRHTGEKPYKCPYCSYTSATSSCTLSHVRLHHPQQPALALKLF